MVGPGADALRRRTLLITCLTSLHSCRLRFRNRAEMNDAAEWLGQLFAWLGVDVEIVPLQKQGGGGRT